MRTATLIALSLAAAPALAQDSLQRCRAVADGAARLACYDSLADTARASAPQANAAAPVSLAIPAAAVAPVAVAPAAKGEAAFGLPQARQPDAVESVESAVSANFSGWGPNTRIRLENGQVWQVIDGSSVSLPEGRRKVSVKRGALSSFYLDIEKLNTSPRVRRVD